MEKLTELSNGEKLNKFVYEKYQAGELTTPELVSILILVFDLLQLKRISKFAKLHNKTPRGVRLFNKNIIDVNGEKFIIDND
jgi:hypothetical protein